MDIDKGASSQITHVWITDSTSATQAGLPGVLFDATGLTGYWIRPGDAVEVNAPINDISILGTFAGSATNCALKQINASVLPGLYELHLPTNMFASVAGKNFATFVLSGAANMVPVRLRVQLDRAETVAAQAYAKVVQALVTDLQSEIASTPAVAASIATILRWLFALSRNKVTVTESGIALRNDADSATIGTSTVSDDGTTTTRGEFG